MPGAPRRAPTGSAYCSNDHNRVPHRLPQAVNALQAWQCSRNNPSAVRCGFDVGGRAPLWFQSKPGAIQIAAAAACGRIGHQHQTTRRDGVDPATRTHTAEIADLVVAGDVEVTQRGRSEEEHVFTAAQDTAAIGSAEIELPWFAGQQIPGSPVGDDRAVIDGQP